MKIDFYSIAAKPNNLGFNGIGFVRLLYGFPEEMMLKSYKNSSSQNRDD